MDGAKIFLLMLTINSMILVGNVWLGDDVTFSQGISEKIVYYDMVTGKPVTNSSTLGTMQIEGQGKSTATDDPNFFSDLMRMLGMLGILLSFITAPVPLLISIGVPGLVAYIIGVVWVCMMMIAFIQFVRGGKL